MYLESDKELKVWQRSIELVKEIYKITNKFPKSELYGLTSQLRRCSISIPSNIAEGYKRRNIGEYIQFLSIADASAAELETQIIIAKEIYSFVDFIKVESLLEEIQKMLITIIKKLNAKRYPLNANSGQSLIEVIIAMTVGAIFIGAAVAAIVPILRSNLETRTNQIAGSLAQEYLDTLKSLTESNWQNIYVPPADKGPDSQFHLMASSTSYLLLSGTTSTVIEGHTFTRYFSIENTNRTLCASGDITTEATTTCESGPGGTGVTDDPSTQKIIATVSWEENRTITRTQYLTRSFNNKVFIQTNWSGGSGQEGPITVENNKFASSSSVNYTTSTGSIVIQGY